MGKMIKNVGLYLMLSTILLVSWAADAPDLLITILWSVGGTMFIAGATEEAKDE